VIETGRQLSLTPKPSHLLFVHAGGIAKNLQGDNAVERNMTGLVNEALPAAVDIGHDLIAGDVRNLAGGLSRLGERFRVRRRVGGRSVRASCPFRLVLAAGIRRVTSTRGAGLLR
jgi:hypothetical protein